MVISLKFNSEKGVDSGVTTPTSGVGTGVGVANLRIRCNPINENEYLRLKTYLRVDIIDSGHGMDYGARNCDNSAHPEIYAKSTGLRKRMRARFRELSQNFPKLADWRLFQALLPKKIGFMNSCGGNVIFF